MGEIIFNSHVEDLVIQYPCVAQFTIEVTLLPFIWQLDYECVEEILALANH